MRPEVASALVALWLAVSIAPAAGASEGTEERFERLERRIEELETALEDSRQSQSASRRREASRSWFDRVRISGSASTGYYDYEELNPTDSDSFQVRDARFFVDAELWNAPSGSGSLVRNIGFSFEWNLVRQGTLFNDVGDLFVEFQAIGGSEWLNSQVGRFQIPVGEAYLRYGRGAAHNPFATNPVGGPWWWDEGLKLYGGSEDGFVGYVASLTNGDTPFDGGTSELQGSLKLFLRPLDWLMLSGSALVAGKTGTTTSPANGALWLGEGWARAFGSGTTVASVIDGAIAAPGPNVLDGSWLVAADAIATPWHGLRLWLGGGRYSIDSRGPSLYDRALDYWIAELLIDGDVLAPQLEPLYLGLRSSGVTTGDDDRGYLLDFRYAPTLGYNMKSLIEYSAVVGWRIGRFILLRGQYDLRDVDLVRAASAATLDDGGYDHGFSFDIGVSF